MRSVVKGRFAALPLIATALVVAACSTATPGTGSPASSSPAPSSSTDGGAALAAIQPCDLLDSSVLSQNDLTSKGPSTGSGARSCSWQRKTGLNTAGFVIGVDIRDGQGINDLNKDGLSTSSDPVGHHQAVLAKETDGDVCDVTIGITPTSRVDISANTSDANIDQACTLANQYAKLIEPKLP
jgi:hypothetical protein